ncbi:MAG TPA: DUF2059 domain-containing protein [Thermodesulfobacteriota bacterium]|nr:DUF2059 domain-containing protein [Thermodesulfobacteriota bacterium]
MKRWMVAVVLSLSILVSAAYADNASQRIIAEDLLQTMKIDQMMKPLFEQMRSMMEQQFMRLGAAEDMKPILKKYNDKLFNTIEETINWKTMKEDLISIYVNTFNEEELKAMLAFYKSPVGQSVIQKMPAAMQESAVKMQKRIPELQEKVRKISEEMAAEIKTEMEKKKSQQ